jgi:hypothetical protein
MILSESVFQSNSSGEQGSASARQIGCPLVAARRLFVDSLRSTLHSGPSDFSEALAMKTPAEMYSPSPRPYGGLPDLTYALHDRDLVVTACGRICMYRKRSNIPHVLAGQRERKPL